MVKYLENNSRIHCDTARKFFSYKSKFPIENIDDLRMLLLKDKKGFLEDDDLYNCYIGCKDDIQRLKDNHEVRIIERKITKSEKAPTILFGRDIHDQTDL